MVKRVRTRETGNGNIERSAANFHPAGNYAFGRQADKVEQPKIKVDLLFKNHPLKNSPVKKSGRPKKITKIDTLITLSKF